MKSIQPAAAKSSPRPCVATASSADGWTWCRRPAAHPPNEAQSATSTPLETPELAQSASEMLGARPDRRAARLRSSSARWVLCLFAPQRAGFRGPSPVGALRCRLPRPDCRSGASNQPTPPCRRSSAARLADRVPRAWRARVTQEVPARCSIEAPLNFTLTVLMKFDGPNSTRQVTAACTHRGTNSHSNTAMTALTPED